MTIARSAEAIERLTDRVERLSISRHDPERFFEDRSEIVFALREETKRLRCQVQRPNFKKTIELARSVSSE